MPDAKISALPNAATLGGTEQIPGVQSAANVKLTPAQLAAYVQQASGSIRVIAVSAVPVSGPVDTNENILATVTIPANALGVNGVIRITHMWSGTSSANTKTNRIRLGGIGGTMFFSTASTTSPNGQQMTLIRNRGSASSQVGFVNSSGGAFQYSGGALTTASINTAVAQDLVFTTQKASAAEASSLDSYLVEIINT